MRKNNLKLLEEEELKRINRKIVPLFGTRSRVISGSYLIQRGKKIQYNITVGETNTCQSAVNLKRIGEKVKEITGACEVYSFGIKLA